MSKGILIAIVLGLVVLGSGAYYVIQQPSSASPTLSENEVPTLPTSNSTSQNGTTNTTDSSTQPTAQSFAGAVVVQGLNRKEASVILFDSQTGAKKEIVQIPNTSNPYPPEVKVDNGTIFFTSSKSSISRRDIKTGQTSIVPLKDFHEPWRVTDFAVKGNVLVFLTIGPANEGASVPSRPCELRVVDLARSSETKVLDISVCSQAHGPNYSIQDISSDGTSVSLLASSGEAGYASITRHEVSLSNKTENRNCLL